MTAIVQRTSLGIGAGLGLGHKKDSGGSETYYILTESLSFLVTEAGDKLLQEKA